MMGVWSNATSCLVPSAIGVVDFTGMLERATRPLGISTEKSKVAFRAGSSRQGKALLASVASNCVLNI